MSDIIQATRPAAPLTVEQHKERIQIIQHVLRDVMKEGTHYGPIPGCGNKKALLKPGAEVILATFGIAPQIEVEEVYGQEGHIRYRVKARALSSSGQYLGEGVGEASTAEEKYAWERAATDEHFDETPETQRRLRWRRGDTPWQEKQVRANPADKANTVLKIAKKRALVDMVLTVTAASDIFVQDIEEDEEGTHTGPEPIQQPKAKSKAPKKPEPSKNPLLVGPIKQVAEKTGTGSKGPWTRYGILVITETGDEWVNTFDSGLADMAKRIRDANTLAVVGYRQNEKGYKDVVVIEERQPSSPPSVPGEPPAPVDDYGPTEDDDIPFDRAGALVDIMALAKRIGDTPGLRKIGNTFKLATFKLTGSWTNPDTFSQLGPQALASLRDVLRDEVASKN